MTAGEKYSYIVPEKCNQVVGILTLLERLSRSEL